MGGGDAHWDDIYFVEGARVQVTIKDVSVEWGGKPPKKWGKATVKYDYNGSARSQNVMSFANPEVFKKVQELVGETVDVEVGKNDKDFTEWRSIAVSGRAASSSGAPDIQPASAAKTNSYSRDFETKEERALRQRLIVRQSSLSAAIATLSPGSKGPVDQKAVLEIAKQYDDWVWDAEKDASGFDNMDNDIPF